MLRSIITPQVKCSIKRNFAKSTKNQFFTLFSYHVKCVVSKTVNTRVQINRKNVSINNCLKTETKKKVKKEWNENQ